VHHQDALAGLAGHVSPSPLIPDTPAVVFAVTPLRNRRTPSPAGAGPLRPEGASGGAVSTPGRSQPPLSNPAFRPGRRPAAHPAGRRVRPAGCGRDRGRRTRAAPGPL